MGGLDNATWQALGLTVTLLGLVVTALVWRRRGPVSGLRALAWSLLPLAAGLTGVLRLAWDIADRVVEWVVHLIFSPVVWLGVVVAGISATLFVLSGILRRRSTPTGSGSKQARAKQPKRAGALPATGRPPAAAPGGGDDDLADIEALLRKHGIS